MTTFGEIMKQAEANGSTFAMLDEGMYVAKIIESDFQPSKAGKPQIKTRWEVTQGPKAGFKGLWNHFTLTIDNPNAMSIFYRQMTALGITGEFMQSLANVDPETAMRHIASALKGRAAQIKVIQDKEWSNNKIDRINPLPAEMAGVTGAVGNPFPAAPAASPTVPAPPVVATAAPSAPAPVEAPAPAAAPAAEGEALPAPPF